MFMIILTSILMPFTLMIINSSLYKKELFKREKFTPFECGFDPRNSARNSFSVQFFLIAMIFLIFDVELTLIMPLPVMFLFNTPSTMLVIFLIFMFIIMLGLLHEWNKGALTWIM